MACSRGEVGIVTSLLNALDQSLGGAPELMANLDVFLAGDYAEQTALHIAAWKGNRTVMEALVARSHGRASKDLAGWSPLHVAVYTNQVPL